MVIIRHTQVTPSFGKRDGAYHRFFVVYIACKVHYRFYWKNTPYGEFIKPAGIVRGYLHLRRMEMKKILLGVVLALVGTGLAFAEFEFRWGFGYGFGSAESLIAPCLQLGYISPSDKDGEQASVRWGILFDAGFSIGFDNDMKYYSYTETTNGNDYSRQGTYPNRKDDFNVGLLGEFYFLPWLGIALGGGYGIFNKSPYLRAEIPFLFKYATLGVGYDYFFWEGDDTMKAYNIDMPPGYRINIFLRLRGEAALALLKIWF
jgi:hypothetical protein